MGASASLEREVNQRLDGLDYTITSQALLPDARLAELVPPVAETGTHFGRAAGADWTNGTRTN